MASTAPTRDLGAARASFGNAEASRRAHGASRSSSSAAGRASSPGDVRLELAAHDDQQAGASSAPAGAAAGAAAGAVGPTGETHGSGGEFVKSLVFGGLDGIITTFAIIAASQGGGLSQRTIILMGFANLLADAISMGVGDFLSETAEQKYIAGEQKREKWEMDNYMDGEVAEMTEIYEARGMSAGDARAYMGILARYPKIFLENMMVDELGLMPIKDDDDPYEAAKKGLVTFLAFVAFGAVPVLVYVVHFAASGGAPGAGTRASVFLAACVAAAVTMFALGAVKARITKQPVLESGAWMLVNGSLAALAAFGVGYGLDKALVGDSAGAGAGRGRMLLL